VAQLRWWTTTTRLRRTTSARRHVDDRVTARPSAVYAPPVRAPSPSTPDAPSPAPRAPLLVALAIAALPACASAGPAGRGGDGDAGARSAEATCAAPLLAETPKDGEDLARVLREQFTKYVYRIPMRDGVKLYTTAYVPRDRSRPWPVLLLRTPYGVSYGVDNLPPLKSQREVARVVPSLAAVRDGFIFVHQDVRGKMMSEGTFVDVRPRASKKGEVDESTDAYDTIAWLLANLPAHNGKVGVWGVSYPGFYAAQAGIDAHPAVAAISPQAPVTEWWLGDDVHHNGALFLEDTFFFDVNFGRPRPQPTRRARWDFDAELTDAYDFFLGLGTLAELDARYMKGEIAFWKDVLAHPDRDAFWQARDPRPHYARVRPAVLTVGGLFDAENLWGALETYRAYDTQSPGADVRLVLGPWRHGGWARGDGDKLGDVSFGWKTARHYQEQIELPFWRRHLKGCAEPAKAEAWVFQTGTNLFERHDRWPPADAKPRALVFGPGGALAWAEPQPTAAPSPSARVEWTSDPWKPVPYRSEVIMRNDGEYMVDDQRFAARRPDVLVFALPPQEDTLTVAGPLEVDLDLSTTGTDLDVIVKLIDVYPFDAPDPDPNPKGVRMAGYQQLVRAEVLRGRYRDDPARPAPFAPGATTRVRFTLPDVSHVFRHGHALMLQVQSTWFPLVDRNPQTYVPIATARREDYVAQRHTLHLGRSHVRVPVR
jgi:putative CocE/NonD family hydrolase